jgi:hypothetical protein
MKEKSFHAWGIQLEEGRGLAGRYWWFDDKPSSIPPHMEGCKSALFVTRKVARQNLKYVKCSIWPKAKVVKVNVTLEWES